MMTSAQVVETSMSPQTVLLRTTLTRTITIYRITISYVIIIINVKSKPSPQPFGLLSSDRKLSVTLFMVTIASVLSILPYAVYSFIPEGIYNQYDTTIQSHITYTFSTLYYASSLFNPFIYAEECKNLGNQQRDLSV